MPYVQAGDIKLHYTEYGSGDNVIVFVHGNLGCIHWMDLVWPKISDRFHIYAFDWRGCGESDKPEPDEGYENYSMKQHATDMINAIRGMNIGKCHLINHSTGGIICTHMLLMAPELFGRVLCLDPVGPQGIDLPEGSMEIFQAMKENFDTAYAVLAGTSPSLFDQGTLRPGQMPVFLSSVAEEQKKLFRLIVDKTRQLSDGIWFGTPTQLSREYHSGKLKERLGEIRHEHLVLWGEQDAWIPKEHVEEMVTLLPNCEFRILPGVGHCLNLEAPEHFAKICAEFFSDSL
ncbi:alpha/beta hydrolase [Desulfonema ishimotonii]|uniref:Alpha/beta hydrolase n=1 Tax=Desulfonema ishimotonii TaxID=45657 RepID=A0A401FR81_9BACT|nr:alpha/beta hydrolase [Desulfonema ishimotonii]GBC59472.1 alpha/beta hydrolase [Desulfonema ishimotonii]